MGQESENTQFNTEDYYKDIEEVVKYSYSVASYQRGYRWDEDNVRELLEDIFEGKLAEDFLKDSDKGTFLESSEIVVKLKKGEKYCIQPLVVKKITEGKYSVIDGQQRLTTIYIILKALNHLSNNKYVQKVFDDGFSIEYVSRKRSGEFLKNISDGSYPDNIDAAYIKQNYIYAKKWFSEKDNIFKSFLKLPDDDDMMDSSYAGYLVSVLLQKTRFIWDEVDENSPENEQKIFKDRNSGKLDLTDSELIKAEFMNPDNYGSHREHIRDRQTLISELWDIYENDLHNEEFWAFLPLPKEDKDGYASKTRIDAAFRLLVNKKGITIKNEEYGLFKAVADWIRSEKQAQKQQTTASYDDVDPEAACMFRLWREVCDLIDGIRELFEDNEIYNLLSLYRLISADNKMLLDTYLSVLDKVKSRRPKLIKGKIKEKLFSAGVEKTLKDMRYPSGAIKNVLIAHNIAILNSAKTKERFAFRYFEDGTQWDKEHIYASNEGYIEGASIEEKKNILELFGPGSSYLEYLDYLYDLSDIIDTDQNGNVVTGVKAIEAKYLKDRKKTPEEFFDKPGQRYDKNCDIFKALKMWDYSEDLLKKIEIYYEIEKILNSGADIVAKADAFFKTTEYDDPDGRFVFLKKEYLFWDEDIIQTFDDIVATGNKPASIPWHGYNVTIPDPASFWDAEKRDDTDHHDNQLRVYYRQFLNEMYDNTGIQSQDITLERHGSRKATIVTQNNILMFGSLLIGTKKRIEEKLRVFFIKENHIEPGDSKKYNVSVYKNFANLINDNSMGNMMLLHWKVNRDGIYRNANFDGKRKRVTDPDMAEYYMPVASSDVLMGKYIDLGSGVRQWLMKERLAYLKDMIGKMKEYYE